MKCLIVSSFALGYAANTALGQGQINVDNLIDGAVVPILEAGFGIYNHGSAQVYRFNAAAEGGIGSPLGGVAPVTSDGRFRLTEAVTVDGVGAGQTIGLIVRAWDGPEFVGSTHYGTSANWISEPLGGVDAVGNVVVTPNLDGFATFRLDAPCSTAAVPNCGLPTVGEPCTIALGVLGAVVLVLRRQK